MSFRFPLLSGHDAPHLPVKGGACLICGRILGDGVAYISAGAVNEDMTCETAAFFQIGFHSNAADVSGSGEVDVIQDLHGGQFDLGFCSTSCLRTFFSTLVDELDARLDSTHDDKPKTPVSPENVIPAADIVLACHPGGRGRDLSR